MVWTPVDCNFLEGCGKRLLTTAVETHLRETKLSEVRRSGLEDLKLKTFRAVCTNVVAYCEGFKESDNTSRKRTREADEVEVEKTAGVWQIGVPVGKIC
jgi:hypothetical protein